MISKDFQAIADRFVWDHEADIGKANLCEPVAAFDGVFGCMIIQTPPRDPATWKLRETQGDNTRAAADAALRDGGYDTLDDFVNGGGYDKARYSDQLQQAYHLVETGGPELKAAAEAAIVGDRKTLDEFITIEQYRRASLDANREAHNDHIDSMLATGRNIANLAGQLASNAQAAYEYSQGSAQKHANTLMPQPNTPDSPNRPPNEPRNSPPPPSSHSTSPSNSRLEHIKQPPPRQPTPPKQPRTPTRPPATRSTPAS